MIYAFGTYRLDTTRLELWRGEDPVAVEPQVFSVLQLLIENCDRVISKEELIENIWQGRSIADTTLSARINAARRAVGDNGKEQMIIRTIAKRGFRFVDEVTAKTTAKTEFVSKAPQKKSLTGQISIAVLPFEERSTGNEQDFLADGIAEDLLTNLSQIPDLFVVARNARNGPDEANQDLREIARLSGVNFLLGGSVRRAKSKVRITAQLVNGHDGSHIWAERYDRQLADLFDLQDEITSEIATALQVTLTEGQQARMRRKQTTSVDAWHFYRKAIWHLRRFNRGDNNLARELLTNAVNLDPEYAAAFTLLAWTYMMDARLPWTDCRDKAIEHGLENIDRAMANNSDDPDALGVLSVLKALQRKFDEADIAGRRAVSLGPNMADVHVLFAFVCNLRNRPQEAVVLIEQAIKLCPVYPDWYLGILGMSYYLLKRFDDAIEVDRQRLALNPTNGFADLRLAAVFVTLGEIEQARLHVAQALKKNPNYRIPQLAHMDPYEDTSVIEQIEKSLRAAGLPD